jgi:hypothetical protein
MPVKKGSRVRVWGHDVIPTDTLVNVIAVNNLLGITVQYAGSEYLVGLYDEFHTYKDADRFEIIERLFK